MSPVHGFAHGWMSMTAPNRPKPDMSDAVEWYHAAREREAAHLNPMSPHFHTELLNLYNERMTRASVPSAAMPTFGAGGAPTSAVYTPVPAVTTHVAENAQTSEEAVATLGIARHALEEHMPDQASKRWRASPKVLQYLHSTCESFGHLAYTAEGLGEEAVEHFKTMMSRLAHSNPRNRIKAARHLKSVLLASQGASAQS